VRPLVPWTQGEGLRRLAFALRPLIDQGLDVQDIAAELTSWWLDWRPARPAAYITARLRDRAAWSDAPTEDSHPDATGPAGYPAWQAWLQQRTTGAVFTADSLFTRVRHILREPAQLQAHGCVGRSSFPCATARSRMDLC